MQTFTEENTSLLGIGLGNILLFSILVAAVAIILAFICLTKLSNFKEKQNKLKQTCSAQEETIKKLSKKVESLTKEINSIKTAPPPPPIVTNQIAPEEKFILKHV